MWQTEQTGVRTERQEVRKSKRTEGQEDEMSERTGCLKGQKDGMSERPKLEVEAEYSLRNQFQDTEVGPGNGVRSMEMDPRPKRTDSSLGKQNEDNLRYYILWTCATGTESAEIQVNARNIWKGVMLIGPISVEKEPELDEDVLTLEEALTHGVAFGSSNIDLTIPSTSCPDTPALVSSPGINPDDYLLIYRKYIHKEMICQWVLNKYFIVKSLNRQEFIISNVFLTIIRINLLLTIALHSWLWTGNYVTTNLEIQGTMQTMEKVVKITVLGRLIKLVNPKTIIQFLSKTFSVSLPLLILLCFLFLLPMAPQGPLEDCLLCGAKTDSMQAHVGLHILQASNSINKTLKEQIQIKILNILTPKHPNGHPLPLNILNTFMLTSLEQCDTGIPETQWLKPVFDDDKENYPGPSTCKHKINNAGGTNVKKACKSA
ncbi:hypothetical protein DEU56DRAFT_759898 [Suillus clintonianus]|uniref:uncharacterized protein n=1 Tax=Suillus clintonianus TaxID=1904413 RepID=UPI001B864CDD|nr:uncharacterized protein DEU56DRAFT_759898 [Suillus clintonianus]KAG2123869.1 hypothetical protein DEU56DRAFT_759898 [Suillus clintonianus]